MFLTIVLRASSYSHCSKKPMVKLSTIPLNYGLVLIRDFEFEN